MKTVYSFFNGIFQLISIFPFLGLILACFLFYLFTPNKILNPDPVVETWCAQIKQYDSLKNDTITYYNPAMIKGLELLSVQLINGTKYLKKDFLTGNELDYNLSSEVITKKGVHFKITLLKMNECGTKTEMDTLAERENDQDSQDY